MSSWPTIDPGEMRLAIKVFGPKVGSGAAGASVEYVELLELRAAIAELERGSDRNAGPQTIAEESLVLRTWFDGRVKSDMQLEAHGGRYIIQQVINERKMGVVMRLVCIALGGDE